MQIQNPKSKIQNPRLAVIGAGAMGRNHLRVLNDLEGVELVGVADADGATVERVSRNFHVEGYQDYRELLRASKPDAVVVAVPTVLHCEVVMHALDQGTSVLVEKPIASTEEEARQMIDAAKRAGVMLTVGHIERYNPAILEL